jgi:hypothetical protein
MKLPHERIVKSTACSFLWILLTFIFGAIQIIITFTLNSLSHISIKSTVIQLLSDNSLLFFFQALVYSLIVDYIFVEFYKLKNNLLVFMLFFIPIMMLFFSLILYFAKKYEPNIDMDVFYSIEIVILIISTIYTLLVKSIFNYKVEQNA